ncbi:MULTISPECIES: HNH endonuclease [unclassified Streptomyces]|uniref:HNH endonuclease n=1 Tax=unclassified Streptomyces TaxID=2593676 RepID=UPI00278BF546|nr:MULTISPECIES: HNH endonuclease [unclassified Streptomyces]
MPRYDWTREELLLACALVVDNGWRELRSTDPRIMELSELLRALPVHEGAAESDPNFRSPNSVKLKTSNIMTAYRGYHGTLMKGGRGTLKVVEDFTEHPAEMLAAAYSLRAGIASGELLAISEQADDGDSDPVDVLEGRLLARWAHYRERDRSLRTRKIQSVTRSGLTIRCEVCGFDFHQIYGGLGDGYIEVHHRLPLHISGPTKTQPDDLALLCANCHRMCHKSFRDKSWRTPDELKAEMEKSADD